MRLSFLLNSDRNENGIQIPQFPTSVRVYPDTAIDNSLGRRRGVCAFVGDSRLNQGFPDDSCAELQRAERIEMGFRNRFVLFKERLSTPPPPPLENPPLLLILLGSGEISPLFL